LDKIKDLPIILQEVDLNETSSFCLGIILQSKNCRNYFLEKLPKYGIECRPVVAGNLLKQPVFLKSNFKRDSQIMANKIHERGIYLPNNQFMNDGSIDYIIKIIKKLLTSFKKSGKK